MDYTVNYKGAEWEHGVRPLLYEGWKAYCEGRAQNNHSYRSTTAASHLFEIGWDIARFAADVEAATKQCSAA
jgi:hypothetical protein